MDINNTNNNVRDIIMEPVFGEDGTHLLHHNHNNNISSILCSAQNAPLMSVYFSVLDIYGLGVIVLGAFIVISVLLFYADIITYIIKESKTPGVKTHTTVVLSVYPIVAMVTYCAMIVPRASVVAEAVTQGVYMNAMYHLFCLFVAYCGGETEFIRICSPDTSFVTKVGPCCCWPCCLYLPKLSINKNSLCFLRMLVLQLIVVQGLVYILLLITWADDENVLHIYFTYVQPVLVGSMLFGIWSIVMTMTQLNRYLPTHYLPLKFFVLQVVLLLTKFQSLITRLIPWSKILPCHPPITPTIYGSLIYHCVLLSEMLILIIVARCIYKRTLTNDYKIESNNNNTNINTIDGTIAVVPTTFQQNIVNEQPQLQHQTIGGQQFEKQKY